MIIDRFSHDPGGIAATVTWEDSDRPPAELAFELPADIGLPERFDAGAFLLACMPIATRHRERRVRIDAPVCPMLVEGVQTAAAWLAEWNPAYRPVPVVEQPPPRPAPDPAPPRAVCFMSGGVDSTFMVKRNRLLYSERDPAWIHDALLVHGFDMGKRAARPQADAFELARSRLARIAEVERINLILVRTNVRHLEVDPEFWTYEFHGAVLAAAGHIATAGWVNLFIAATNDVRNMIPWGSHPHLDVHYASQRVRVIHDGVRFSRLDKVRALAESPHLIDNIRVCTKSPPEVLNCGRCEKCVRTKLELLAAGQTRHAAFPYDGMPEDVLEEVAYVANDYQAACYRDLIGPLEAREHIRLARLIEAKLRQYRPDAVER